MGTTGCLAEDDGSVSLNPALALLCAVPGGLFSSAQAGNSFPSCGFQLQASQQPDLLLEPGRAAGLVAALVEGVTAKLISWGANESLCLL